MIARKNYNVFKTATITVTVMPTWIAFVILGIVENIAKLPINADLIALIRAGVRLVGNATALRDSLDRFLLYLDLQYKTEHDQCKKLRF